MSEIKTSKSTLHLGVKTTKVVLPIEYASRLVAQSFHHIACLVLYSFRSFTLFQPTFVILLISFFPEKRLKFAPISEAFLCSKNLFTFRRMVKNNLSEVKLLSFFTQQFFRIRLLWFENITRWLSRCVSISKSISTFY